MKVKDTKYDIGEKVYFMYEGKVKSDEVISIKIELSSLFQQSEKYTIFVYFGVFHGVVELYGEEVFKTEKELLDSHIDNIRIKS